MFRPTGAAYLLAIERVMLIRRAPGSERDREIAEALSRWRERPGRALVFFQGPGLAHVRSDSPLAGFAAPDMTLMVCSGGWRRRGHADPGAPFVLGSLLQFWSATVDADEIVAFGAAGS